MSTYAITSAAGGEYSYLRDLDGGTWVILPSDPDDLSMLVGMLVDELNDRDHTTGYVLEEYVSDDTEPDDDDEEPVTPVGTVHLPAEDVAPA